MPVRSLNSAVFKWPNRARVLEAARAWAGKLRSDDPLVRGVYCVGSYARGDWGVGSDLDVIVIVRDGPPSIVERHCRYEPREVPVPADVWVYTDAEWEALRTHSPHLRRRLQAEMIELAARDGG